jgi:hypothetical protein
MGNSNPQNPDQNGQNDPSVVATPELDSAMLFVVGGAGAAIPYFLMRRRARRKEADPQA